MNLIWIEASDRQQFLNFCDRNFCGACHRGIEISCRSFENQVARFVAFPGFYDCEIGLESMFHHVHFAIELPDFLALGDFSTVTGRRKECWDSSLCGTTFLCQSSLWREFNVEFTRKHLPLEFSVFAHV